MTDQGSDLDLAFTTRGQGPPILALHGFGATSYSRRHLELRLDGRGKMFLLDLKGRGNSPAPLDDRYSSAWSSESSSFVYQQEQHATRKLDRALFGAAVPLWLRIGARTRRL